MTTHLDRRNSQVPPEMAGFKGPNRRTRFYERRRHQGPSRIFFASGDKIWQFLRSKFW